MVPKAIQYGPHSLTRLGATIGKVAGRELSEEEAIEVGIWCYMLGKMERWTDAILSGRRPQDDIIDDLRIYATMCRRVRIYGSWPGVEL